MDLIVCADRERSLPPTECNRTALAWQPLASRAVIANFDGGDLTSDAGGLALREVDARIGLLRRFAACFQDHRRPEHSVEELVAQRVYGLALGYEDLNDHDQLRRDPLLAVLAGKSDPQEPRAAASRTAAKRWPARAR